MAKYVREASYRKHLKKCESKEAEKEAEKGKPTYNIYSLTAFFFVVFLFCFS